MDFRNTREVARLLGISASRLARAVWDQRFAAPSKGPGGACLWTEADARRASRALLGHDLGEVTKGQEVPRG